MEKNFAHLHLHTEFSLLDGAIKIPEMLTLAKEEKWKSIAITDHGNIFGAVKFFQKAEKSGIKPILGIEMYFTPDTKIKNSKEKYFHLLLLVQNKIGYKNLCELLAFSYKQGFYFKPRIDYEILKTYSDGLIATTACIGGHIPSLILDNQIEQASNSLDWFLNVFGPERFFIEVQPISLPEQKPVNDKLFEFAKEKGIRTIATCDAHYLKKEEKEAHEILLAIQTKHLMSDPDRMTFGDFQGHLRTTKEMLEAFPDNTEAVWNTGVVADLCEFKFEFGKLFFPQCSTPKEHTQESYFKHLCTQGLKSLKEDDLIPKELYDVYDKQLNLEIDLIIQMGFVGYFLVVSDFIRWAKSVDIPVGPGRGSAAGSLVAWAIGITNVDPIRYNLLFERFLNPERVSMPDIDIDFCIQRREEVIDYVREKYGHDCVCQIITFGTMMAKGVIKDVARTLGFPFQDSNALTELIPNQLKITLKEAIDQEIKLKEMINNNPKVKNLFDICFKLEGLTRHASKHAAGVVISPEPLKTVLPLYVPSKSDELVTQFAMTELESVGFLKMDFLGLKNLTVIERALKAIKRNHGIEINLDKINLDDKATFKLLQEGKTNGVFQFESEGIKQVLVKLCPEKFEDLIAVNALYRPGPLGSGMVDDFIDRKHGRKKTTYMFAELEPILSETYGVIVYQEQVMKIASAIAGYTLGGADILRRAMGKKKAEVMAEQKSLFVKGAISKNFNEKKAAELFDLMAYFAGYGFNKSHSTAYALIAYHTAYLKANYPKEFLASLVSFETSNPDQLSFYLQEIADMGIKTILPDINRSEIEFSAEPDGILFGLQGIKNVGTTAIENILEQRKKEKFVDLLDFCKKVDLRTANKRVIENLIYAGAMDIFPGNRAQKLAELDKIIKIANNAKEESKTGQMSMFSLISNAPKTDNKTSDIYTFAPLQDLTDKEKLEKEKEVAGFYLSSHPLKSNPIINWIKTITFTQALEEIKNMKSIKEPQVTCVGLMQTHRIISTKKGDKMAFAQFEDFSGHCEVIIFPSVFNKCEEDLKTSNIFVIKGFVDATSPTKCKIKANELIPIENLLNQNMVENVTYVLPNNFDNFILDKIKEELKTASSENKFFLNLKFTENNQNLYLKTAEKFPLALENLQKIEKFGVKVEILI